MKKPFTEEGLVRVLKESEAGAKTPDFSRKVPRQSGDFCTWKSTFDGLEVSAVAKSLQSLDATWCDQAPGPLSDRSFRMKHPHSYSVFSLIQLPPANELVNVRCV